MITQQQIDEIVTWDGLKNFGRFVLSHCEDGRLHDYKKMDLMQVPKLVPYTWVWDLRNFSENWEFLINFSGEEVNQAHSRNIMGENSHNTYSDDYHIDDLFELYKNRFLIP